MNAVERTIGRNYYLPFFWTFTVRYASSGSIINLFSFFLIDVFPSLCLVFVAVGWNPLQLLAYALAFFVMFCFYECGYIFNEIVCTRYEEHPTLRLPPEVLEWIPRHMQNLLTIRIVLGVLGSWWLLARLPEHGTSYLLCLVGLLVVYSLHNFFRSKVNLLTMAGVVSAKYLIPMSIFLSAGGLVRAWFMILLSVVGIRVIEYAAKKQMIACKDILQDVDAFRIRYYLVANVAALAGASFALWPLEYCALPAIFLCYRIGTWFLMHHAGGIRKQINANRDRHGTRRAG